MTTLDSKFIPSPDALKWKAKAARGKNKKIFGVPLERNSADLPPVLAKCLEYFAAKGGYYKLLFYIYCSFLIMVLGVLHEGLFRLSGNQTHIHKLRDRFDEGIFIFVFSIIIFYKFAAVTHNDF